MHQVSRKDLNSAEMETVRVSESPPTVVTANGEVLTKEEATVYVGELDLLVTVMFLEDARAVLSLCEDQGYNFHWTGGQKPHVIATRRTKYHSLSLVYRQALLHLQHILHRRKPSLPRSIPHKQEVRV